jgi:hypothetical protein
MSRDMRSSARKPTNAAATTITSSEIGRRNANDTKFMVPPQPAAMSGQAAALTAAKTAVWEEKRGSDIRANAQLPRSKDLKR